MIDHGGTAHLRDRNCPVCDSHDGSHVAYPARIDKEKLGAFAFASRKFPAFMHLRLLKCPTCEVLYASPALTPEFLANVYREAGYDGNEEAEYAAATYAGQLDSNLREIGDREVALESVQVTGHSFAIFTRPGSNKRSAWNLLTKRRPTPMNSFDP